MRTFNVRLFAILVASVAVFGVGIYLLHGYQVRRNAHVFLEQADKYRDEAAKARLEQNADAVKEAQQKELRSLKEYCANRPEDFEAAVRLGSLYVEVNERRVAMDTFDKLLRQAQARGEERSDVRRKLVDVAIEMGAGILQQRDIDAKLRIEQSTTLFNAAQEHLQNYLLKENPKDGELWELLAKCQEGLNQNAEAVKSLEKAVALAPQQVEAYDRLARLLLRAKKPKEARQWTDKLVAANPGSYRARLAAGILLMSVGSLDEATENAIKAADLVEPALAKAEAAAREAPLDSAVQREYRQTQHDRQQALLIAARCLMTRAAQLADKGEHEEAATRFAEARKYARRAIELYPGQTQPYQVLSDIEQTSGRLDDLIRSGRITPEGQMAALRKAEAALREGVNAVDEKDKQHLMWRMAAMLIDAGQTKEAGELVEKLRAGEYSTPQLAYLEGCIARSQGNWQKAIEEFDRARVGLAGTEYQARVDFFLGQCYGRLGNPDQEQEAYRRALAADPNHRDARINLIASQIRTGKIENAMADYQVLRKLGIPRGGAALALAEGLIQRYQQMDPSQRRWTLVEDLLAEARNAAPDSVQVALLEARMHLVRGAVGKAEETLRAAAEQSPKEAAPWIMLAELAERRNAPEEAESLLRKARDESPESVAVWLQLAAAAQRRKAYVEAGKILDEAERNLGDSVELRLARAAYIVQCYPAKEAAPRLRKLAEDDAAFSPTDRVRLWHGLHFYCQQVNDLAEARRLYEKVAQNFPRDLQTRFHLFELAQAARDDVGMKRALDEVKKIEGEGPLWSVGEALRLYGEVPPDRTNDPRLDRALSLLAAAGKSRPSWPEVPRVTAYIYERQGKPTAALRQFQQAIKLGERREAVYARAGQLLAQQKRYPEAESLIEDFRTRQGILTETLRQLQEQIQMQRGDVESALASARQAAKESKDYRAHLRLGQLLLTGIRQAAAKGDSEAAKTMVGEAAQAFQTAVDLAGGTPETWLALVRFLSYSGQPDKAKEVVAEIRNKLPAQDLQTPLTLAQCYQALGDADAAQKEYEALLAAAPDNPTAIRAATEFFWLAGRTQQAEAQLQRILGGRVKAEPSDVQWARRVRAAILLGQGGYHNQEQARKLIEQNLADEPASTADLRLKAQILHAMPDRARRDEAIGILERLAASPETRSNDDWFNLGLLYKGRGEEGKYNQVMQRLLAVAGDEPRYLADYIIATMQRGEMQTAERWLDHLERVAPNQFNATSLRAELLVRRGKYEEALDVVRGFVDRPAALPADGGARRLLVAETLERLSGMIEGQDKQLWQVRYVTEAESLLRQYASQRPAQEVLVIGFLARQGKLDEALDLLERIWPRMNPAAIGQIVLPMLQPGLPSKQQLARGEKILAEALERFDRPAALLMAQADLRTLHQRYAEAEKLYREVLAKSPASPPPVALNNLAVLLALQGIKLDEALKLIDRAIDISGPIAAMLDSRASVYIALGQPDKALADLQNALAEAERPERLFHQAQAYRLKGDNAAAAAALRKANEKGLTAAALQPLERPSYAALQKLLKE